MPVPPTFPTASQAPFPPAFPLRAATAGAVRVSIDESLRRRVVLMEVDPTRKRGALSTEDGDAITTAVDTACAEGIPLVASLASSGADVSEGVEALHGWGRAAHALTRASGVVPLLAVVNGPAVSGPALLLGLADHVVFTRQAQAFVSGPRMVRQFTGQTLSADELGGATIHAQSTGVAVAVVDTADDAMQFLAELLAFLPDSVDHDPPLQATTDPADRLTPEAGAVLPATPTGSYDVRHIIAALVDDGYLLELRARWAGNLVTGLASIGGRTVGVVANQPMTIAGTLDIPSSQKGARFVAFCDAFNIPLVTLVDTPGFYPGKDLEWRGMIRHGAQLAFAYARATVPRVCVTLRKSYGGAFIVMDSKTMGNDMALAWPSAEVAVMGAKGAVQILHRRSDPESWPALEAAYEERLLNPYVAADRGLVDAVIDPAHTRRELAAALDMLSTKREQLVRRSHDNGPL